MVGGVRDERSRLRDKHPATVDAARRQSERQVDSLYRPTKDNRANADGGASANRLAYGRRKYALMELSARAVTYQQRAAGRTGAGGERGGVAGGAGEALRS